LHNMPITPTADSFSFFAVFMSHHVKPKTVDAYLSGVCNQLEPVFPNVREIRKSRIVARTLAGCKKLYSSEEHRKRALTRTELRALHPAYSSSTSHDDSLFWAILLTGFHALMRLGELVSPDREALRDYRKIVRRSSVHITPSSFDFYLPGHKADRLFEGNRVLLERVDALDDPYTAFTRYLKSRDSLFPYHAELWLRADGTVPTRGWFMRRLRHHFPTSDVAGHSLRSGGATAMAEAGVPLHLIQK
ncbi:hypothetical protein EV121DRAFT_177908, partial [Schizophyllum commune]